MTDVIGILVMSVPVNKNEWDNKAFTVYRYKIRRYFDHEVYLYDEMDIQGDPKESYPNGCFDTPEEAVMNFKLTHGEVDIFDTRSFIFNDQRISAEISPKMIRQLFRKF